jgi:phosphoglucomutase
MLTEPGSTPRGAGDPGVDVMIDKRHGYTPTSVISRAILTYDGIVVTPSHNPPEDGGTTRRTVDPPIPTNALLAGGLAGIARIPFERAPCDHDAPL